MGVNIIMRSFTLLLLVAAVAIVSSSEVEDLGSPDTLSLDDVGESTQVKAKAKSGTGGFFSALMTSGNFMMMQAGAFEEEEESDELGEANDWDLTNGGKCEHGEEAWVLTDASSKSGKCVKFADDKACGAQCFHQGKSVDQSMELGEGQTMYLTKSKVMQAGLKKGDLGEADPMACAGVANNKQ